MLVLLWALVGHALIDVIMRRSGCGAYLSVRSFSSGSFCVILAMTKFGQTKFGQIQVGPDQIWPNPSLARPSLAKTKFRQTKFGQDQVWPEFVF